MYRNKWWDDSVNSLGDHLKTVLVVLMQEMGTHESEDWHDIMENTILSMVLCCECRE